MKNDEKLIDRRSAKLAGLMFFLIMALAGQIEAQGAATMLIRGEIDKSPFEMTLRRDGSALSGSYFYTVAGRAASVKVVGTIQEDGKFTLLPITNATQNGTLSGRLTANTEDLGIDMEATLTVKHGRGVQVFADGQVLGFSKGWRIETHHIREKYKAKHFGIDAAYLEVTGTRATSGFNLIVKTRTNSSVNKFRKMMLGRSAEEIGERNPARNELSLDYNIKFADDELISVELSHSDMSNGMVHPMFYFQTLNYDLRMRRKIKLADLFRRGSTYLEILSAYCLSELRSRPPVNGQKLAGDDWAAGAGPDRDNFENWNLTSKGLLISFGFYQIAAYPAGINYVLVPFSRLKDIARPGGMMARMIEKENR